MKIQKAITIVFLLGVILLMSASSDVFAQERKVMSFNAEDAYIIQGLGAVIVPEEGKLKVTFVPPSEVRPKELREVDIKDGDFILMLNGRRIKTVADIREQYDSIAVGELIEFGIQRDKDMLITSYDKPDESSQQSGKMMMVTKTIGDDSGEEGDIQGEGGTVIKTIRTGGPEDNTFPLMDAGLILSQEDNGLKIMATIDNVGAELTGTEPMEGDLIIAVQDQQVNNLKEFRKIFDAVEIGAKVTIGFQRGSEKHLVTFTKTDIAEKGVMKTNMKVDGPR
jgi:S1-C subfamily serine protease